MLDAALLEDQETAAAATSPRGFTGPLLIAGRDDDDTAGALRIAELLARRDRVNAHVLTLVPPLPFTVPLLLGVDATPLNEGRRQEQLARMRQRVAQTVGRSAHFSASAELGSPTRVIASAASSRGAELILVGLGAPGAPGRAATEDATLQVTRTAGVPVLAVPPDRDALPRRALVAMDFAEASVRAARASLRTLAAGGCLTLAHVGPDLDFREVGMEAWGAIYAEGVAGLFRRLVPKLSAPGDVEVETTVVRGDTAASLLDLASRGDFDLIAAGSRSAPWPDSDPAGSVSAALLRGAACAVLIAPPPEGLE
jgi:nucleotide-binding universal stress UspA family protein